MTSVSRMGLTSMSKQLNELSSSHHESKEVLQSKLSDHDSQIASLFETINELKAELKKSLETIDQLMNS
jgi:peptidoglycan hydrolase CwlO-like protein